MKKPQIVAVGFLGNPAEVSKALSRVLAPKKKKPEAENKPLARGEVAEFVR